MSQVLKDVREAVLKALKEKRVQITVGLVQAFYSEVELSDVFKEPEQYFKPDTGWTLGQLFDIRQGVTWGGSGCETIFVLDEDTVRKLGLEPELVRKTIGGEDIEPWKINWKGYYLLFPYIERNGKWIRAFLNPDKGDMDVLDFTIKVARQEDPQEDLLSRLRWRIAEGLVKYPRAAEYLVRHYDVLSKRIGSPLPRNRKWYEFHRPREPILVKAPKIVCRRLMREPVFALDEEGYLPRDSVWCLIPRPARLKEVKTKLRKVLKRDVTDREALNYILHHLNSGAFKQVLNKRISRKRGGFITITKDILEFFIVPEPK